MKKINKILLSLVASSLLLVACGSETSGSADGDQQKLTLSHQPYSHALPSYIADANGTFEENGFDTEILMFTSGPSQNEALGANEWEIGALGMPGALSGGVAYDSKIIGVSVDDMVSVDFFVRPDSEIVTSGEHVEGNPDILGTPEAWKGKTILLPTATTVHMYLIMTLNEIGLTTDDVNIVHMDVSQAYTAFQAGEGDIVGLWDPQSYMAEDNQDWVRVSSGEATGVNVPTVVVASEKVINENPQKVEEFLRIYFDISEELKEDNDTQAEYLLEMQLDNGLTTDEVTAKRFVEDRPMVTLEDNAEWFADNNGTSKIEESVNTVMEFFVNQGNYSQEDWDNLIENGFVDGQFIESLMK